MDVGARIGTIFSTLFRRITSGFFFNNKKKTLEDKKHLPEHPSKYPKTLSSDELHDESQVNVTKLVSTVPTSFIKRVNPDGALISSKVAPVQCQFSFLKSQINKGTTPTDCLCSLTEPTGDFKLNGTVILQQKHINTS